MLQIITSKREEEVLGELSLDEIARRGAEKMLAAALKAEADYYVERLSGERDEKGRALVVRNGSARPRKVTVGSGVLDVVAPRVDDQREGEYFSSEILPRYMRKSPRLVEALPLMYLKGMSSGDFVGALHTLLGAEAAGFSASTIIRLTQVWTQEYEAWKRRDLKGRSYAYIWVDGVYFNIRLEEDRLAMLVIVGVLEDGSKELIALEDGFRESAESWAELLRDLKERGMKAPLLATGDGALGFWKAVGQVYPETAHQRCWVHKIANVLDKLPKRLQSKAKEILHQIMNAEKRSTAEEEMARFEAIYRDKHPKAVEALIKDKEALFTYFNYPAAHWIHLRTTNPIESTFATVKLRTKKTRGAGSRRAAMAMAFQLMTAAQDRWRRITSPERVVEVMQGIRFIDGVKETKEEIKTPKRDAA